MDALLPKGSCVTSCPYLPSAIFSGNSGVPCRRAFQMYFTSNHDENSWNGTEYDKYGICAGPGPGLFHTAEVGSDDLWRAGDPLTCRLPFFDKAGMEWPSVLRAGSFYSSLCAYRRNGLAAGEFRFLDAPEGILAYRRTAGEAADEWVAMNLGRKEAPLSCEGIHGRYLDVLEARGPGL